MQATDIHRKNRDIQVLLRSYFIKAIGLILIGVGLGRTASAQNVNFSQFHLSPVQTNPAMIATSNQIQFIFNYRNQFIGDGQSFETPMASAILPWIRKGVTRRAAFGVSFLQDRTGENGILTTTGGLGTAAWNFNLSPLSAGRYQPFLSIGGQAGYFQRMVNERALTTGNQWTGTIFDPNSQIGEQLDLVNTSETFFTLNGGALFYLMDTCGRMKAHFGVNVQNINQPTNEFFTQASPIPLYYVLTGGINFDINSQITLQPNLRWVRQNNSDEYRAGLIGYYNFFGGPGFFGEGSVGAGVWYDSNSSIAIGLEVHQPKYFVGFSYDLGASNPVTTLGGGALEVSLGIKLGKSCLQGRKPKDEVVSDTTVLEVKVPGGDSVYTIVASIEGAEVLSTDTIDRRFISTEVPYLIPTDEDLRIFQRKAFFYYLSEDINKATAALLTDIAEILVKFKGLKIELQGHTCNIGDDNQELSLKRSNAVRDFLTNLGASPDQISISGYGSTRPLLSNKTEYGRIKNRRVEFEVIARGDEHK